MKKEEIDSYITQTDSLTIELNDVETECKKRKEINIKDSKMIESLQKALKQQTKVVKSLEKEI